MVLQKSNNGFYFTLLDINGRMISEGQYSYKSGLWVWENSQYKNILAW